jgi:hypothetical protein
MTSTLPAPALQASRAALNAALAEQPPIDNEADSLEPGEIQEVDMEQQAEGIRTVFSDPKNFNVKVKFYFLKLRVAHFDHFEHFFSIPCIPLGPSGLTLPPQKAAICLKLP